MDRRLQVDREHAVAGSWASLGLAWAWLSGVCHSGWLASDVTSCPQPQAIIDVLRRQLSAAVQVRGDRVYPSVRLNAERAAKGVACALASAAPGILPPARAPGPTTEVLGLRKIMGSVGTSPPISAICAA